MTFTQRLIDWYQANKRTLPFRDETDPYKIWVSEIMAQQTQLATMIPYYNKWIKDFPTVESLAQAPLDFVLKHWEGLGYYNRARNLHKGAIFVMEHYQGQLPADKALLMEIPGIGEYTSSAIASIAFNLPEIAIDGNVKRVMARFLNYQENVNTRKAQVYFETFLKSKLEESWTDPKDFTAALMELGSLVCTPSNVTCIGCPFKELCACWRGEVSPDIPITPKAKKGPTYYLDTLIMIKDKKILLTQDDSDGLMKGYYRLPQLPRNIDREPMMSMVHKFTHLTWDIYVHEIDPDDSIKGIWVPLSELDSYSYVTAHRKILHQLGYLQKKK